jgi:hypothetical protein
MRDVAATYHTPTLFALIPAPYQVDTADVAEALGEFKIDAAAVDLDQPNRLLVDAMRPYRLNVFDALPEFRRREHAGARLYGSVDRHLSPAGHDALERLVEPVVTPYLSRSGTGP